MLSEFYWLTHSEKGIPEIPSLQRHSQQRENNAYGIKTTFLLPPISLGLVTQGCKREEKCSRVVSRPEALPGHQHSGWKRNSSVYFGEKDVFPPPKNLSEKKEFIYMHILEERPRKIPLARASSTCLKSQGSEVRSRWLGAKGYSWLHSTLGVSLGYMKLCLK